MHESLTHVLAVYYHIVWTSPAVLTKFLSSRQVAHLTDVVCISIL